MRKEKHVLIFLIFLFNSPYALAHQCDSAKWIAAIDSPYYETVYNPSDFNAGFSNADRVALILNQAGYKARPIVIGKMKYDLKKELLFLRPHLIVMHISSFYKPQQADSEEWNKLMSFLEYASQYTRANILLYSREYGRGDGVGPVDTNSIFQRYPWLEYRLEFMEIKSFDYHNEQRLIRKVKQMLEH